MHSRHVTRGGAVRAALTASPRHNPPRPASKHQMRVKHMFEDTHIAMLDLDAPVLEVTAPPFQLTRHYYFRRPDDIQQIVTKDDVFRKSQRVAQSKEWLGDGLFSQLDYNKHAAMRETLNPAFRMEYLKQLDTFFLASASQLAVVLKQYAATSIAKTGDTASSRNHRAPDQSKINNNSRPLEMQQLFRLCTLDSLRLASMKHDFNALSSWQQQMAEGSESSRGASDGAGIDQMLSDLSKAFAWQSLVLPIPRSWLPGWGPYITACRKLDVVWRDIVQQRKGAHQPASSTLQKQDLLGFLLLAQQKQGSEVITDEMIGDEIKTMIFAGSDTSSFTMAMVCCAVQRHKGIGKLAHHFAAHPQAAERAAQEVHQLLESRGGDAMSLHAGDVSRLPYLTACVNETLRLAPAGPAVARTAQQDLELAGYHIPNGLTVIANIYAMHRTPEIWARPDEFVPERWMPEGVAAGVAAKAKNAFLPFSAGARSCIGRSYAMLQMMLTWALLLSQGIRFTSVKGAKEPVLAKGLSLYAVDGIHLRPELL